MQSRRCSIIAILCLATGHLSPGRGYADEGGRADPAGSVPKLAVVIVIDQFRADFLTRFGDLFIEGGFKLLMDKGASFSNCHYDYAVTKTGPGHSSIASGANPAVHGVVGNDWHEQGSSGSWVHVDCVDDSRTKLVGLSSKSKKQGASPRRLMADTLTDQLKAAHPASRVLCCSLKDTAAILLAGKSADQVYWWHTSTGDMVTSDHYRSTLPKWAAIFNDEKVVDRFLGRSWERIAPLAQYTSRCRKDDFAAEWGEYYSGSDTFPHRLGYNSPKIANSLYYRGLYASPFGNEMLLEFAGRGMDAMQLGQREVTDLLLISLSSNDLIGHAYGPFSHEVMDVTLRTDRQLARFFRRLDEKVGLANCLIVLTSDHGACRIPEFAVQELKRGGRSSSRELEQKIDEALITAMGQPSGPDSYIAKLALPWLYFEPLARQQVTTEQLRAALRKYAKSAPQIEAMFLAEDIRRDDFASSGADKVKTRVKNCYYAGRSGEVYVHLAENWYAGGHATGHGTAHDYDTHVPLLLFGQGVRPGRYENPVAPTDIAKTLAHLLKINPPSKSTGRILKEALLP